MECQERGTFKNEQRKFQMCRQRTTVSRKTWRQREEIFFFSRDNMNDSVMCCERSSEVRIEKCQLN